ncbi:MAG TPA: hypothetical protein VFD54_03265 [Anaerolineales bacterium]|nr:hypothetical protein [Anaerolineales bacterium]
MCLQQILIQHLRVMLHYSHTSPEPASAAGPVLRMAWGVTCIPVRFFSLRKLANSPRSARRVPSSV